MTILIPLALGLAALVAVFECARTARYIADRRLSAVHRERAQLDREEVIAVVDASLASRSLPTREEVSHDLGRVISDVMALGGRVQALEDREALRAVGGGRIARRREAS